MRRLLAVALLAGVATQTEAQVRRRVPRVAEPSMWTSFSVGLFNANDVSDGKTDSRWDFGRASNAQFRASLEKAISSTASIGATGTFVRAPFTYVGAGGNESCTQCAAHIDIASLAASFHIGGGVGLHQVIEASAGAVQFRNLTRDSDDSPLAPTGGNIDPYFTFAYGFGYSLNPASQISVVQEFGLALHESNGLDSNDSNTLRNRTIRVNFRYGFGKRTRR